MKVLVGGQKVKLESQNSDKKSKYWKESQSTAQSFLCKRVFGSWTAFFWESMILYAVQLKYYIRVIEMHCMEIEYKCFTFIQKIYEFHFLCLWFSDKYLSELKFKQILQLDNPSKADMVVNCMWREKSVNLGVVCVFVCLSHCSDIWCPRRSVLVHSIICKISILKQSVGFAVHQTKATAHKTQTCNHTPTHKTGYAILNLQYHFFLTTQQKQDVNPHLHIITISFGVVFLAPCRV